MRRFLVFALVGMMALWLTSFLPDSFVLLAVVVAIGVGVLGGLNAKGHLDVTALSIGAGLGTAWSGLTQGFLPDGPTIARILAGVGVVSVLVGWTARLVLIIRKGGR